MASYFFLKHFFQKSINFNVRHDIWTGDHDPSFLLEGVSNERSTCTRRGCLILKDEFLFTGWVAAHELGHA